MSKPDDSPSSYKEQDLPGICGIIEASGNGDVGPRLAAMLERMRHHDWYAEDRYESADRATALGRFSLGRVDRSTQPVGDAGSVLVMDGELYGASEVRRDLALAATEQVRVSAAALVLRGLLTRGQQFFSNLHGSFTAAIWDENRRRLTLTNDRFALRPLYYTHRRGQFLFASSMSALMADPAVPNRLNAKGLAQFFTYGHYLGSDTSLQDVQVLPAAAWLTYDAVADQVRLGSYRNPCDTRVKTPEKGRDALERVEELFVQAVNRRTAGPARLGLALSGGLDARTILAVMDTQQTPVTSVCYSVPGSLDDRASRQMTRVTGSPYRNYVLDENFLAGFRTHLEGMVRLTDGQYLSQCIMMPTLPLYRELGIEALLRGHAGELLHMRKAYSYSIDDEALSIRTESQLEVWLTGRLRAHMLQSVDRPLFRPQYQESLGELAHQSLREALAPYAHIDPVPQRIWHLFLAQRLRRETALSMVKFGSAVEPRLPYLDNDLVDYLLELPPEKKLDDTFQTHILRKHRPEFIKIVNANTGTRLGAGRLATRITMFRNRVFAKIGLPGYQPYERLGLWLRRELAPLVKEVLLDQQSFDRGVFEPDGVRSVVDDHLQRKRNHTYLIMALMIFELGQRQLNQARYGPPVIESTHERRVVVRS